MAQHTSTLPAGRDRCRPAGRFGAARSGLVSECAIGSVFTALVNLLVRPRRKASVAIRQSCLTRRRPARPGNPARERPGISSSGRPPPIDPEPPLIATAEDPRGSCPSTTVRSRLRSHTHRSCAPAAKIPASLDPAEWRRRPSAVASSRLNTCVSRPGPSRRGSIRHFWVKSTPVPVVRSRPRQSVTAISPRAPACIAHRRHARRASCVRPSLTIFVAFAPYRAGRILPIIH